MKISKLILSKTIVTSLSSSITTTLVIVSLLTLDISIVPKVRSEGTPITVTSQISSGNDDVEERNDGWVYTYSSDLDMTKDDPYTQAIGLRFLNVQLPQGADITNAFMEFTVHEATSEPTSLIINGESNSNSAAFVSKSRNVTNRIKTQTSVDWGNIEPWTIKGAKHSTPNVSSIVKEISSLPSWVNGNAMSFIINGNGKRVAKAFEGGAITAAKLYITYSSSPLPSVTPTPSPVVLQKFAIIGDYGQDSTGEQRVASMIHDWNPDFILTLGDNSYTSDPSFSVIDKNIGKYYQSYIGNYKGIYGPGSTENKFWPIPGNHDWDAANLNAYLDYFTLPGNERYYDVTFDNVRVFTLDSDYREPDGAWKGSRQYNWLKNGLETSTSCFDLVLVHHPPYTSGTHKPTLDMQWPYREWGADIVIAGHDHDYERIEKNGFPYLVNGLGGAEIRPFSSTIDPDSKFRYNGDYGAQLVTVTSSGISFEFYSASNQLIDSYTISKNCALPTPSPSLSPTPSPSNTPTPTITPTAIPIPITVSSRISSSNDDVEEWTNNGWLYSTSSDLELTWDNTNEQAVGNRFTNLPIPKGAKIVDAYIEYTVREVSTTPTNLTIYGEASSNSLAFSGTKGVTKRPTTIAKTEWDNILAWSTINSVQNTPSLVSVVQEIVNRSDWAEGNAMSFIIKGIGNRNAYAFDGGATRAPKLVVTYEH